MARLALILAVLLVAVTVYTLVDWALLNRQMVRGPAKALWLPIILLIPVLGVALWFLIGRTPGRVRAVRGGPDDDPEFLRRVGSIPPPVSRATPTERRRTDADEIRRLEEDLARTDADDDGDPGRRRA